VRCSRAHLIHEHQPPGIERADNNRRFPRGSEEFVSFHRPHNRPFFGFKAQALEE
jgi:hypothetical protein